MANLDAVLAQAMKLDTLDKVRLIEKVSPKIEQELLEAETGTKRARRSLWGVCRDLGPAPSSSDIEEARREMWPELTHDDLG